MLTDFEALGVRLTEAVSDTDELKLFVDDGVLDGDSDFDGVLEALSEIDGVFDLVSEIEAVFDIVTEIEADFDMVTEMEGVIDMLGVMVGVRLADAGDAEYDTLAVGEFEIVGEEVIEGDGNSSYTLKRSRLLLTYTMPA